MPLILPIIHDGEFRLRWGCMGTERTNLRLDKLIRMDGGMVSPAETGGPGNRTSMYLCSSDRVARARLRQKAGYYDRREVLLALAELLIACGALWVED